MNEVWKDIGGFNGIYQVSNFGSVRSLDRYELCRGGLRFRKGRILKLKINKSGYLCCHIRNGDISKHPSVHRLVAESFIDNAENKSTVNHIDCNKQNNEVSNLEWATHSEQMKHASENGLIFKHSANGYKPKITAELKASILDYHKNNECSISSLSKMFFVSERTVGRLLKDGITIPKFKISEDQAIEIIKHRDNGMTLSSIAKMFNCGISQVHRITKGLSRNLVKKGEDVK